MMISVLTFFAGRGTTNRLRRSSMPPKTSMVIFILLCLGLSADTNLASAAPAGTNKPGDSGLASAPVAAAPLTIQLSPGSVLAGSPFKLSVMVGSATTPVVELFGLGFGLRYAPLKFNSHD